MLQTIRGKATGFVSWLLFGAIALAFTLWGANGFIISKSSENTAAKVNGYKVSWYTIDNIYQKRITSRPDTIDPNLDAKQVKYQIRDDYATDMAYIMELHKNGFSVSDQEVIGAIVSMPDFHVNGKFSPERYKSLLYMNGITEDSYQSQIRDLLLEQQPQMGMVASSYMLDSEKDSLWKLVSQTRDVGYTIISKNKQKISPISNDELLSYYSNHKNDFISDEKIKVDYVVLSLDKVKSSVEVTDEKLREFYSSRTDEYSDPEMVRVKHILVRAPEGSTEDRSGEARAKAEDILAKLKLGEDSFSSLVEKYSEDKFSSADGDLGWLRRGELNPEFEDAAFSITSNGKYSSVVKSPFGYHIIQRTDYKPATVKEFNDVRDSVKNRYTSEIAETILMDRVDELANVAFENSDAPMQVVADISELELKQTGYISRSDDAGVISSPTVMTAVFSDDLKESRLNSEILKANDTTYVLAKVVDVLPPKQKSFEEVRDEIALDLENNAKTIAAEKVGMELLNAFKEQQPFDYIKAHNLKWNTVNGLARNDNRLGGEIVNLAFSVSQYDPKDNTIAKKLDNGDFVVVNLVSVGKPDERIESSKEAILNSLPSNIGQLEYGLYRDSLVKKADIKYYDSP